MQIQAKWENGAFHPVQSLHLKHSVVMLEIDEEEIVSASKDVSYQVVSDLGEAMESSIRKELKQILGEYRLGNSSSRREDDKRAWHKHLEHKHL